jgi:hypothetical protein
LQIISSEIKIKVKLNSFFFFQFSDKKEKWVPVEIPITTQKHRENSSSVLSAGGARINSAKSSSRPNSRTADKSKNWRDDAKGKFKFCFVNK